MISPCVPPGKSPILQFKLAFKQAGHPPDPVLTPDCANLVVCCEHSCEARPWRWPQAFSQPGTAICILPMCCKIGRGQGNPTEGWVRTIPRIRYPIQCRGWHIRWRGDQDAQSTSSPGRVQSAEQGPWQKIDRVPVKVLLEVPKFLLSVSFGGQGASCLPQQCEVHSGSSR